MENISEEKKEELKRIMAEELPRLEAENTKQNKSSSWEVLEQLLLSRTLIMMQRAYCLGRNDFGCYFCPIEGLCCYPRRMRNGAENAALIGNEEKHRRKFEDFSWR